MKKMLFSAALGLAVLFPTFAVAISVDQTLVISQILGRAGRFYNLTVPDFAVTVSSWSERYELPANFLIPGEYVLVDTNDPDGCATFTLDECRSSPYFVEEIQFSIKPDSTVPSSPKETATAISTNETGMVPLIINGVLDFLGMGRSAATTTVVTAETAPADATVIAATTTPAIFLTDAIATTSTSVTNQESAAITATSAPQATGTPILENAQPQEGTTTAQTSQVNGFLAAIVGSLSLGTGNTFIAIVIAIGIILLLAFILGYTKNNR